MESLSPFDLIMMENSEQLILRCLSKQPQLTLSEIAQITNLHIDEVTKIVDQMVRESRLIEQFKKGQRTFSARFGRNTAQVRNLPPDLLAIFDQPNNVFLANHPVVSDLPPQDIEQLHKLSRVHKLVADEVLLWQGKEFDFVGLVRNGLLRETRLQNDNLVNHVQGYIHRSEWIGLVELLTGSNNPYTLTSVAETDILLWPRNAFLNFLSQQPKFSLAISRLLSRQLEQHRKAQTHKSGKIWVLEGLSPGVGTTTIALNLASLTSYQKAENSQTPRVVLWNATNNTQNLRRQLHLPEAYPWNSPNELLIQQEYGFDILAQTETNDYPPQVKLDITLNRLQADYDYIIIDSGSATDNDLLLRLRGQAGTLVTITDDPGAIKNPPDSHNKPLPFTRPGQTHILLLNKTQPATKAIPPFHLVFPDDKELLLKAKENKKTAINLFPQSAFSQSLTELHRQLSLTHTVGIFIPSSIDTNQNADTSTQIEAALQFFDNLFGKTANSEAKDIWQNSSHPVTEQVVIVRTFVSKQALDSNLDAIIEFAVNLKKDISQEAVAIDIDNQLVLV